MLAAASLTFSPFLTIALPSLMFILPSSIAIFNPTAPNSLIAGPGIKSVGPASTIMSSAASCPILAFTGLLFSDRRDASSNGLSFENINA